MSKYYSISELSEILNSENINKSKISNPTLRYWEKEFKQIKPKILNGNRRYYNKENIDLLKKIKYLLKDQGMTINGVKKLLNSRQSNELDEISNKSITTDNLRNKLTNISQIVKTLKKLK